MFEPEFNDDYFMMFLDFLSIAGICYGIEKTVGSIFRVQFYDQKMNKNGFEEFYVPNEEISV